MRCQNIKKYFCASPEYSLSYVLFFILGIFIIFFCFPGNSLARIYIDINAPSIPKFNIAIPDFKNPGSHNDHGDLAKKLAGVISNDLDLSGYFRPMDKKAFLEEENEFRTLEEIRFKDWSVIGAELVLKGGYTLKGKRLAVEIRLFDVFWGRQILSKKVKGDIGRYRYLIHLLGDDVVRTLTGHESIFLTKLAFVGTGSGHKEIYTCDYDGHNVKQITKDKSIALLPRWSPDGTKMVFNSYKDGGPKLYMKKLKSKTVRQISGRSGLNIGASWAPSGKELALTLSDKGNPDLFLIKLNGKVKRQLTSHWGIDVAPNFSPDGTKIVFVSRRSGAPQIYIMDLIHGTTERLTYADKDKSFKSRYNTSPCWSSRGRIAFVSMDDGYFNIWSIDPEGRALRRMTENQGNNEDPSWSPDGRYLVFSSDREGSYHLYIMNANGRSQRRVTFLKGDQTGPSWAP
ncbi:MAG: Tol-Pal system beta propeller repeat protein TolB [Desulfobacterales bacterium]|nr:Tol-Pal system beta propeller repeat protein TolB [Desulfobacterales bacterium]